MKKNNDKDSTRSIMHEINNLFGNTNLSVEMLLRELAGPLHSEQKKYLRNVLSDLKKIQKLVEKLKG